MTCVIRVIQCCVLIRNIGCLGVLFCLDLFYFVWDIVAFAVFVNKGKKGIVIHCIVHSFCLFPYWKEDLGLGVCMPLLPLGIKVSRS